MRGILAHRDILAALQSPRPVVARTRAVVEFEDVTASVARPPKGNVKRAHPARR